MPTSTPPRAPRTALEAAQQLAVDGHHVHYVSEGQAVCISHACPIDSALDR
ncbi:hypothetical protein ACWEHT_11610 [Streptomyces sp. NPDC004646]